MAEVYLSLGSNIDQKKHIRNCLKALRLAFGEIEASPVYESEAVGFDGDNFYNLVVKIHTQSRVGELLQRLRKIEDDNGRVRKCARFSARTLDIDILTYDDLTGVVDEVELPRDEILKNAFVLLPLVDIAGDQRHPISGQSYVDHWQQFDQHSQKLWQVDC